MSDVFIISAKRTPIGKFRGQLSSLSSPILGATALKAVVEQGGIPVADVDEVIMGNVLTAGVRQAPARQASLAAGLPLSTGATTINKVCGSAMKAIMIGHDAIKAGSAGIVAAGGMECMSQAPHLAFIRDGVKSGPLEMQDHMLFDGINNSDGRALGLFSEECAVKYGLTRKMMDDYAMESARRAKAAQADGTFAGEIVPVEVNNGHERKTVALDEIPQGINIAHIPELPPAFKEDGRLTAATASGFCDGAAAVLLISEKELRERKLTPLARIVAQATHSQEPEWFADAPIGAIRKVLEKAEWAINDVDLVEINEALAPVPMSAMKELGLPPDQVNVHGGALALGHPIGASGARIVVTLLNALKSRGLKRGVAAICIGGGESTALALELS
ncbi:thiolase family protein [Deltaproteobacteria bacterium OttesenSCG-928-M10]|nr:thiolase family protein [Deltaproteobacteria bacterium OttesenSCG-928-M10]